MFDRDDDAGRSGRSTVGVFRGTLVSASDGSKMQTLSIEGMFGEKRSGVEHWHPYGFTAVPLAPGGGEAEVIGAHIGGSRSHMVVLGVADRRHRPKGLAPGEVAIHDNQGQSVALKADGVHVVSSKAAFVEVGNLKITMKAGRVVVEIADEKVFVIAKPPTDLGSCAKVMTQAGPAKYVFALPE